VERQHPPNLGGKGSPFDAGRPRVTAIVQSHSCARLGHACVLTDEPSQVSIACAAAARYRAARFASRCPVLLQMSLLSKGGKRLLLGATITRLGGLGPL
jgi:hypothetical protein